MKLNLQNGLLVLLTCSLMSCGSTKKLDFNSAYKFSRYNYNKSELDSIESAPAEFSVDELTASLQPTYSEAGEKSTSSLEEDFYTKMNLSSKEAKGMSIVQLQESFEELSARKRREVRKELKREVKEFRKESKDISSPMEINSTQEISELMRWSIIIGSVGLVLLILGAIFTGILTFFGAIFVVGAAVLFIFDQV